MGMHSRRDILEGIGSAALLAGAAPALAKAPAFAELGFEGGRRQLVTYPQKRPLLRLTARPPQLETPFAVFDEGALTPNDAFFVRYHLADAPPSDLDAATYRLTVGGAVSRPLTLGLADLKRRFKPADLVAVLQCSGNGRGFASPRVAGGQLGNGAMGNARWTGVPLKAIFDAAGVKAGAKAVSFDGLDGPVAPDTPDFAKSLDIDHASDGEVMVAWAMNGADLPILNGFPLRLVVPGHYGTYWVKHLSAINVLETPFDGYWMTKAYRIPDNDCACVPAGTKPDKTRPIGRYNVRSFITNLADGAAVSAGRDVPLRGIAFDGGSGIAKVELSGDGGRNWQAATLGQDLGRYAFREWRGALRLPAGPQILMVRATANSGEVQPMTAIRNPAGYMRNSVETVRVTAA